jgi:hypothetical protein
VEYLPVEKRLRRASRYPAMIAVALMLLPTMNARAEEPARKAGEIVVEQATLTLPAGNVEYELGTLYVPENRSDPKSRLIGVGFVRFTGTTRRGPRRC